MRNLKKVLSMTLALVMMLGMMTFAGAAETTKAITSADLKDMNDVVNKEAVSLLVDLGVINGVKQADGTIKFMPKDNITRGSYAKMIYAVKMATDKADVYKGANTGLKDVKGHWAEGYIAYCVSTKIAAGNGNGAFMPDANISVVAGAKMLLTALGYDAKLSKYENDPLWSINIMADAQAAGLMEGVNLGADEILTRDSAAQMIYNALFAEQVKAILDRDMGVAYLREYVNKYTAPTANKLGEFVFKLKEVTAQVLGTKTVPFASAATLKDGQVEVAVANVDANGDVTNYLKGNQTLTVTCPTSLVGHEVKYFTDAKGNLLSTNLIETGKTKVSEVTADYAKFIKDNSLNVTNTAKSVNFATPAAPAAYTPASSGTIIFINTDGDSDKKIEFAIETNAKFAEVTAVNTAKGTITIDNGFGTRNIKDVAGTADLVKGDFVLYAVAGSTYTVEKASFITGKMTALKTTGAGATEVNKITVAGTVYTLASVSAPVDVTSTSTTKNAAEIKAIVLKDAVEGKFYTDKAGNIVLFVATEEEKATTLYAYIEAFKVSTDEWDSTKKTVEVKAVLADGTKGNYKVANIAEANANDLFDKATAVSADFATLQGVYGYTLNKDGAMVVPAVEVATVENADFVTGNPKLVNTNVGSVVFADDATVLFYTAKAPSVDEFVASYTGVDKIPNFKENGVVYALNTDGYAVFAFAKKAPIGSSSAKDYAYCISADKTTTADGDSYNFVVNGKVTALTISGAAPVANSIYSYTTTEKGITTLSVAITGASLIDQKKVLNVNASYVIVDNDGAGTKATYALGEYTVDDLTTFKDGDLQPAVGSLYKDGTVILVLNDKNEVVKGYNVPAPAIAGATVSPTANQTKNVTLTATAVGATDGKVSYQWYSNSSAAAGGAAILNATDSTFLTTAAANGTAVFYNCIITVTSELNSGKTATAPTAFVSVTVPTPVP